MELIWSGAVGVLAAVGIFLLLERHVLRVLFGLVLLSNAVNLGIFVAGRLTPGSPPLIRLGEAQPPLGAANSLPQALILTAIVIGFGLLVFALILAYKANLESGTPDVDNMAADATAKHPNMGEERQT